MFKCLILIIVYALKVILLPPPLAPPSTPPKKYYVLSTLTAWKLFWSTLTSSRPHFRHCCVSLRYNTPALCSNLFGAFSCTLTLKNIPNSNLTSYSSRRTVVIVFNPPPPPLVPHHWIIVPTSWLCVFLNRRDKNMPKICF